MNSENERCFRFQGEVIRQIQVANGENPCFGMPGEGSCDAHRERECLWSHDCRHEADEMDVS